MITVTFFLWHDPKSRRNGLWVYNSDHVNVLVNQVARNLSLPHRFVLICDKEPFGLDPRVSTVPLDRTTFVDDTRFAKLMLFKPDIGQLLGERIFYLDLDTVITGSIDSIVDRPESIVLWRHPRYKPGGRVARYNSSIILLTAGARSNVWLEFPNRRKYKIPKGEDQGWISIMLGDNEAYWDASHGVYTQRLIKSGLPANAKIVTFPGAREPGLPETQAKHPWIREYRW